MPLHFVVWGHLSSLPKVCVPIESRACWIAKVWLLPPLIEMVVAAVVFDLKYLQKRDVPSSLISWMPLPASEKKPSWKIGGAPTGSLAPPAGSMQIASAEAFCFAVVLLLLIACLANCFCLCLQKSLRLFFHNVATVLLERVSALSVVRMCVRMSDHVARSPARASPLFSNDSNSFCLSNLTFLTSVF